MCMKSKNKTEHLNWTTTKMDYLIKPQTLYEQVAYKQLTTTEKVHIVIILLYS